MKDSPMYKLAAEHGCLLTVRDDGVFLVDISTSTLRQLVAIDDKGIRPVAPLPWDVEIAETMARLMRNEVRRIAAEENKDKKTK
jgi:hypothetical protein